jgi:hypothetical protein
MKPIVPSRYDIGFVVKNSTPDKLKFLEVFCDTIYCDIPSEEIDTYIKEEQKNTTYDLTKRIRSINDEPLNDVVVYIDGHTIMNGSRELNTIQMIPEILDGNELEPGEYGLESIRIKINRIKTYHQELIVLNKTNN